MIIRLRCTYIERMYTKMINYDTFTPEDFAGIKYAYCPHTMLTEQLGLSRATIINLRNNMLKHKDRYGQYAVITSGHIALTSYLALIDYITYRTLLDDPHLATTAPPFDPEAIARLCCWVPSAEH